MAHMLRLSEELFRPGHARVPLPLTKGGSRSAVMSSSARSGAAEGTCFHRAPSAGGCQWRYRIIVPVHALMAFFLRWFFKYRQNGFTCRN